MTAIERARQKAATILNLPPAHVIAQDLTEGMPWVQRHTILVAGNGENILTFAMSESGELQSFQDLNDLIPINRFFAVENVNLPDGLPPEDFAYSIRTLVAGTGGMVGSPQFLDSELSDLAAWLRPPRDESEEIFVRHTEAPSLERDEETWRLSFFYFNRRGAVERWVVEGHADAIESIACALALPEWTFRFPYV